MQIETEFFEPATELDIERLVASWIQEFLLATQQQDATAADALFTADSWWRDLLALGWNFRRFHGQREIGDVLANRAGFNREQFTAASLSSGRSPQLIEDGIAGTCIVAFFEFSTSCGEGRAILRLRPDEGEWRAWTLLTALQDLRGHEQRRGSRRPKGLPSDHRTHGENWEEWRERIREFTSAEPEVLIIGSGHNGLMTAAHLGFWGVPTLILERNPRVGDNWRNRYRSLVLHDTIWSDDLPGMPFPDSFPVYMPKDKLAGWLESYAEALELNVWTGTELLEASYDDATARWAVLVRRPDGTQRTLKPRHVVMATGVHGEPRIPEFEGISAFAGTIVHSSDYSGRETVAGKRAVVVGAGTSAHDVAEDLHRRGFEVTLLQRSSTYVIKQETQFEQQLGVLYHEGGMPVDDADLLQASFPYELALERAVPQTVVTAEMDRDLLARLEAVGYRADQGIDGGGGLSKIIHGPGGYYVEIEDGCCGLIADGKIKVMNAGVERFTATSLLLTDGSMLDADLVVLGTGYKNMRETARRLLGAAEADRCDPVWGLNDDGEMRGVWRPTGHPGLWFQGGPFHIARLYSRYLALQLHARAVGLTS